MVGLADCGARLGGWADCGARLGGARCVLNSGALARRVMGSSALVGGRMAPGWASKPDRGACLAGLTDCGVRVWPDWPTVVRVWVVPGAF